LDALVKGINKIVLSPLDICHYHEHALEHGAGTQAITYIQIRYQEQLYSGVAISKDVITASINALLHALNRIELQENPSAQKAAIALS